MYHVARLRYETVAAADYPDDIDEQGTFTPDVDKINSTNNYSYDELGQLKSDKQEDLKEIFWTLSGKVSYISRTFGGNKYHLHFKYDALGNRISKEVISGNGASKQTEYYIRDAQGNLMAMYKLANDNVNQTQSFALTERPIYGSSRIGVDNTKEELLGVPPPFRKSHILGNKNYELSNHLGSVLVTVSDRKIPIDLGNNGSVDYYTADVVSAQDMYSFGSPMPGRTFNSPAYRYGYNKGSEKDDEISGAGNHFTTLFREGDTRLLIWWGGDPKPRASLSPYSYMDGNPILLNDPDGDCPPGSPCAGGQVGLSFKLGTKQNRIGVTVGGFAGFGSTEASGGISLFGNASSFGRKGGSFEMQLTGGLTQGIGGQTSSNQPHDFSIGANNTGRAGSLSLYTTAYFGTGGTNQRVASFGFTAGNLKATVEDDYLPFVASKDNKFSSPLFGDAEDRFRSAAVNIEYKLNNDFTAVGGFKLFTGDPKLYGKAESAPNGFSSTYNSVGPYSTGILYGGLRSGNYTAIGGWNSEKIRTGIQNGVHTLIGSPYVPPVQGGGVSRPFLEIGTNSGTTSY